MEYQVIFVFLLALIGSIKAQFGDQTIMNILQNTAGLQTFASWCREIEYQYTLRDPITVFAFNDTAFNTLPSVERQVLQELDALGRIEYVRSFTVQNKYGIANLYDGQELTSVQGRRLFVNKKTIQSSWLAGTSRTFINGGMIIREELQASNGVIHVLDKPVSPISKSNVFEILSNPDHSGIKGIGNTVKLKELMQRIYTDYFAAAIAPLSYEDKVTFFLPSQQAFDRINQDKLNALSGIKLAEYFQMHYIPKFAVYTSIVDNTASFTSGTSRSQIIFKKIEDRVAISSGGVTAQVVRGNITVDNGVIHIIDRMLGFVYNTGIEQIDQDAREFSNFIQGVSPETKQIITQPTGLSMFVPRDEAFALVRNLPGINIDGNQTLKEMVVRLSMVKDGAVTVTQMGEGNYESRQRRVSYWNNMKIVIYNDRNETWVNGGNVRAKIIRPDVGVTTGMLQYVDRLLGIPTMDIPTLIYYDDYLLRTYYEMQRVHLDQYLADPRFDASALPPRHIDPNAWNNNYGQNQNMYMFTTQYPNQYPTQSPGQATQYPNNIPESEYQQRLYQQNQQSGGYPSNQGGYPSNQYNQGGYPSNQGGYPSNQGGYPSNQGGYPSNQGGYPSNQYNQGGYPSNQYNQGGYQGQQFWCDNTCGEGVWGCQFTFFVPNGTAIENFYMRAHYAQTVLNDACRFRFILRRLVIPHRVISLENLNVGPAGLTVQADTGEYITIRKETDNDVRILWKGQSARAIMWDLGAVNGIVHIVDQILSDSDDQHIDISRSSYVVSNTILLIAALLFSLRYVLH